MDSISLNESCPYATSSELDYLRSMASLSKLCVMIGAGPGVMAVAVVEGNPSIVLHVIDNVTLEYVGAHLAAIYPAFLFYKWLGDSSQIGRELWSEKVGQAIDLLIVDGDHTLPGVTRDLDAWLPHMAKGGIVFLHDYDATGTQFESVEQYPGVWLAVNEILESNTGYYRVAYVGTSIVYRRQ